MITLYIYECVSPPRNMYVTLTQHYCDMAPLYTCYIGDHGGPVVTHSPKTSEACISNPRRYVGKLVVAYP